MFLDLIPLHAFFREKHKFKTNFVISEKKNACSWFAQLHYISVPAFPMLLKLNKPTTKVLLTLIIWVISHNPGQQWNWFVQFH